MRRLYILSFAMYELMLAGATQLGEHQSKQATETHHQQHYREQQLSGQEGLRTNAQSGPLVDGSLTAGTTSECQSAAGQICSKSSYGLGSFDTQFASQLATDELPPPIPGSSFEASSSSRARSSDDLNTRSHKMMKYEPPEKDHKLQSSSSDAFQAQPGSAASLRQVFFIHRHGDRTPITFASKDSLQNETFWSFNGLGQLTHRGKARLHLLGRMMRDRYNEFLGESVNKKHRISRSSGSLRCIESAQMFLASFLALDTQPSCDADQLKWDDLATNHLASLWQAAAIQTASPDIDGLLFEGAKCKKVDEEYKKFDAEAKQLLIDYKHEADVLRDLYGFPVEAFYMWFWASSFLEVERSYFESKMMPEILKIYDRVQEAGNKALKLYQSTHTMRRLRGGLLINDIASKMEETSSGRGEKQEKFVHYSGHDLTLIILLGILNEYERINERPDYASSLTFELHEDTELKEWYVKAFFMPVVPGRLIEVQLECSNEQGRCPLEGFNKLIESYRIESWANWMKECDNNIWDANPYAPAS